MVKDYEEFMGRVVALKEEMKKLGIETIDLNYGTNGVMNAKVNDAGTYAVLRRVQVPDKKYFSTFHFDGWLVVDFHDMNDKAEEEYKRSNALQICPF